MSGDPNKDRKLANILGLLFFGKAGKYLVKYLPAKPAGEQRSTFQEKLSIGAAKRRTVPQPKYSTTFTTHVKPETVVNLVAQAISLQQGTVEDMNVESGYIMFGKTNPLGAKFYYPVHATVKEGEEATTIEVGVLAKMPFGGGFVQPRLGGSVYEYVEKGAVAVKQCLTFAEGSGVENVSATIAMAQSAGTPNTPNAAFYTGMNASCGVLAGIGLAIGMAMIMLAMGL